MGANGKTGLKRKKTAEERIVSNFAKSKGWTREVKPASSEASGNPRIAWRINGTLVHMLGRWDELMGKWVLVRSPFEAPATYGFLLALNELGMLDVPDKMDIVLLCDSDDEGAAREDERRERAFARRSPDVVLDLHEMREKGEISSQMIDLPYNGRSEIVTLVSNAASDNELLAGFKRYWCAYEIWKILNCEFNDRTKRSEDSVFTRPIGSASMSSVGAAKKLIEALSIGIVDVDDLLELMAYRPCKSRCKLQNLLNIGVNWQDIPELAKMFEKANALMELWRYGVKREGLQIHTSADELLDGTLASRLLRLGEFCGIDSMLRAYASGVPVEDITA